MARGLGATTSSSNGFGGASNTRRATTFARVVQYRRLLGESDAKEAELKKTISEDGAPFLDPRADTKTHSLKVFRMFADVIGAVAGFSAVFLGRPLADRGQSDGYVC
jgi:hypothetical protein